MLRRSLLRSSHDIIIHIRPAELHPPLIICKEHIVEADCKRYMGDICSFTGNIADVDATVAAADLAKGVLTAVVFVLQRIIDVVAQCRAEG